MPTKSRRILPVMASLLVLAACDRAVAERPVWERRAVDLTHPFDADTVYWPTEPGFALERVFEGRTDRGYFYAANRFRAAEHGGTHVDAPIHFHEGRDTVDRIPLSRLIGPGVVVDVRGPVARDPDHEVSRADLDAWENEHGTIPDGAIVLLRTGLGSAWPDREAYMGTSERGEKAVAALHFPGLAVGAARWLADERRIRAVGIDTPSIDHGPSSTFDTHVALFERNVPAFENVASLEQLPPSGFAVIALPMKIGGGSGAPLRIIALLDAAGPGG